MPMILYTFFDSYDLSGKTIAPFCTSGGSGLSNTVNEMKELEPSAAVTTGLHIGSSSASNPDQAVSEWLAEIGLAE
ncbi:flavodoxin [Hominifimenecus sp. rT4P-3]|uniref:flavodoxin n=1 Tax=Hominifimenecus sp. rT4P-3 TaxID=3242979 RepID=UPI003DA3FE9D